MQGHREIHFTPPPQDGDDRKRPYRYQPSHSSTFSSQKRQQKALMEAEHLRRYRPVRSSSDEQPSNSRGANASNRYPGRVETRSMFHSEAPTAIGTRVLQPKDSYPSKQKTSELVYRIGSNQKETNDYPQHEENRKTLSIAHRGRGEQNQYADNSQRSCETYDNRSRTEAITSIHDQRFDPPGSVRSDYENEEKPSALVRDYPIPRRQFPSNTPVVRIQETSSTSTIEVSPGEYLRLRGAEETWKAIQVDFYMPTECSCCDMTIFCIQDADFCLCPECRVISPMLQDNGAGSSNGGVGLGFTMTALAKWQEEIEAGRG